MQHHTIALTHGRRLICSVLGQEGAPTVVYLHGNPGSRCEVMTPAYAQAFEQAGLRVVTVDRPGYGHSSRPQGRGHQHLAADMTVLFDTLGIGRCALVGYSRGCLPALAVAAHLPHRIGAVGLLGSTGMPDDARLLKEKSSSARLLLRLVKHAPSVARGIMRVNYALDAAWPSTRIARLKAGLPSRFDRDILDREGAGLIDSHHAGLASDPAWIIEDWRSWLVHPLGFDLETVHCPVHVWSGVDDRTCPPANARRLANRLANLHAFVGVEGMGHLHTPAVLVNLMQHVVASSGFLLHQCSITAASTRQAAPV